jgi:pimeloyl-ACP methyl ester carboxylesterase
LLISKEGVAMEETEDLMIPGRAGQIAVRARSLRDGRKVVLLVQGSNLTGQSMFDFRFPGGDRYSMMDELVAMGFGAVTFSIRGYGASELAGDPLSVTTEAAMEDLGSVLDWLESCGHVRPHVLAFSWGGRIAGRYAEEHGARIERLVLYDPARGGNAPIPADNLPPWHENIPEFYTQKLEPEFTEPELLSHLCAHVGQHDTRSPNGIRLENAGYVTPIASERIGNPCLLVYGVEAAKAPYMQAPLDRAQFFERLASDDKAFVILPRSGDFAHFQAGRFELYRAIGWFLGGG